jgi:hypothetical protein
MKAAGQSFFVPVMTWFRLVLVVGMLAGGAGCKPKIGEDCATSVDCSISGDRLCDVTQPSGYCTVFNCEPNQCPDEAACVAFSEGTCSSVIVSTRFRRTFCMRTCEDDSDCRGGSYRCIDVSRDQSRRIVDANPNQRICAVPSANQAPPTSDPAVCFPSDASFDVSRPEAGGPSPDVRDATADADAAESSPADRREDADDANGPEAGIEASTDDTLDSSRVETSGDVTSDAEEPETAQ